MSDIRTPIELAAPVIVFHDDDDYPMVFGHPDTALIHINMDPPFFEGATIFDAEGRRLSYRREPRRRLKWWHLVGTNMSDFDVTGEEQAQLRRRLEAALSDTEGSRWERATLSALVDEAFSRWEVD